MNEPLWSASDDLSLKDSKVLSKFNEKDQKGDCNITNYRFFPFLMSSEAPAFKVPASDPEFWIELNEY